MNIVGRTYVLGGLDCEGRLIMYLVYTQIACLRTGRGIRNKTRAKPEAQRQHRHHPGIFVPSSYHMYQTLYALEIPDLFSHITMVGKMNGKYVLLDLGPQKPWCSCPSSYAAFLSLTPKADHVKISGDHNNDNNNTKPRSKCQTKNHQDNTL